MGLVGFTLDYGVAIHDKAKLTTAADVAALAAVNQIATVLSSGGSAASAVAQAQTTALNAFKANAGTTGSVATPTPTIVIPTPTGLTATATVSYTTNSQTQLSKLMGIAAIPLAGTSTASQTLAAHQNYYVLIDISQSMGIGATSADMASLYQRSAALNLVNGGCVFACHSIPPGDPYSMEYVAHNSKFGPPIQLRLDAALSGVQAMIQIAKSGQNTGGDAIQIALYTMSGYAAFGATAADMPNAPSGAQNMLRTITGLTSDWSSLTALASSPASAPVANASPTIELGANNGQVGYGDSIASSSLDYFYQSVLANTTNGTGASSLDPQNFVIILTDGLNDVPGSSCTWGHCTSAFDTSFCTQLKSKASVGVIYTTYNTIYAKNDPSQGIDDRYSVMVAPVAAQIAPALQNCASSPALYFEAVDGPAIIAGFKQMMQKTARPARLTH